jgi:serine phosphatase RsbU (regulator of sigma subunit)
MLKKTKYILLLLRVLGGYNSFASENKYIDSLQEFIRSETSDTARIAAMIKLSVEYTEYDRSKAFESANRALSESEKINYQKGTGLAHNCLGDLYWFSGDYTKSSDHYFKALAIYESMNDKNGMAECYRNIGWIYQGQQNFPLTLEYYNKSLKLNEELGLKKRIIANYDDLGIAYKMMKKYPEALDYCQRTIHLAKDLGSEKGVSTGYGNLGAIYYEMGNYDLSVESYKTATKMYDKLEDHYNLAEGYNGMANSFFKLRKPDKTIEYAEKALQIGKDFNFKTVQSDSYNKLAYAYASKKDFVEGLKYLELFSNLQDSTYNESNSEQINEMSAKYESEKKELMINSLEKDKGLSEEKLKQEKNFKIYLGIFCLMIAAFAFFLFKGNIQKKKANDALSSAYKEIEIKNKDITDSINYSKRIQDASLPAIELKNQLFPDSFILFKPKDIVSGDFYWYTEKDGKKFIAACDCTGHGVPGALMSMIGNNILNQIVNEKGIVSPGEILTLLHSGIRQALKQDEYNENRDGMDIALISFNDKNKIEFAGAQRPLWLVRNSEIIEIKGDKFSIGGIQTETERIFTNHILQLEKNDTLYIFTDGYADQFGGADGKKFMTKNLKELFLKIQNQTLANQCNKLESALMSWKNNLEQVDDILVIGIKAA